MSDSGPSARVDYVVRLARADELPLLEAIEDEAGLRFDTIPELAGVPAVPSRPGAFERAFAYRQVFVAVVGETVVGFAYAEPIDGVCHLEEVDVLPAWGRRGIGRALVEAVVADARARGCPAVTLTTFRDVPWNAPFYARLGFRVLTPAELTRGLAEVVAHESARGLPASLRVVMRREV